MAEPAVFQSWFEGLGLVYFWERGEAWTAREPTMKVCKVNIGEW